MCVEQQYSSLRGGVWLSSAKWSASSSQVNFTLTVEMALMNGGLEPGPCCWPTGKVSGREETVV